MKLWNFLKKKMNKNPNSTVFDGVNEMSFEDVIIFAERIAQKLNGVKCCAILCESEMLQSLAVLSCFAAGVTALPLSKRYGEVHCNNILRTVCPDAIFTDESGNLDLEYLPASELVVPKRKVALIMCTSGTSGKPKGAMLTEKNIISNICGISDYFKIGEDDTILISRPLYHCAVLVGEFLTSLVNGTSVMFYSGKFNPSVIAKLILENQITAFCGTPTLMKMMTYFNCTKDCKWLKHVCVSGEVLDKKTAVSIRDAFPDANIYHVYGLTEAGPRVSYLPPELFDSCSEYVGIPLKSVKIKILSSKGKKVKTNEIGVLWVKSKSRMLGYYNDSERTKKVIKIGWLCTGDLARINEAGLLQIKGRNDDLIIRAGMNIYPQEVEMAIKSDPRVREVLVYPEKGDMGITCLAMNISGKFADVSEVRSLCDSCLPKYQIPAKISLFAELPKSDSGKLIRRNYNT